MKMSQELERKETLKDTCLYGKAKEIHSPSMKTERLYFLFRSKNEVSHLCMDSAIMCPKHVGTIPN